MKKKLFLLMSFFPEDLSLSLPAKRPHSDMLPSDFPPYMLSARPFSSCRCIFDLFPPKFSYETALLYLIFLLLSTISYISFIFVHFSC